MADNGKSFTMQPPVKHLLMPQPVAQTLQECQFGKFTGKVTLLMQSGNIIAVSKEDAHATSNH
jgi:hypothetical protein